MQVNMLEAKTDLSRLVKLLELKQEEQILIARNGTPIVEMRLVNKSTDSKRIGVAKGKFTVPEDFDQWDAEIADMFGDTL
ncbi:MAG: hypothetical protein IJI45_01625 [Anaerolineaceae bacterium]|nr:type II toxin-antitoxin system Phd/YefM family antitoxin [Oscillospiraceae bacterium]MBQ6479794.1 hypothetical protein [Anaerolineaceae bacterium]